MSSLLGDVEFGTVPTWISAVVTSFALLVAARSYARSVRVHREEQARLVYSKVSQVSYHESGSELEMLPNDAKIGGGDGYVIAPPAPGEKVQQLSVVSVCQVTAVIHNGSRELIGPAKIQVVNTGRKSVYDTFSLVVGVIDPEDEYTVSFVVPNPDHPGQPSLGTTLIFRDASGQWWRRHLAEPIEAVHDDPENRSYTKAERAGFAATARAMGIQPTTEPRVPLVVRWRRLKRRLRRKSPIP